MRTFLHLEISVNIRMSINLDNNNDQLQVEQGELLLVRFLAHNFLPPVQALAPGSLVNGLCLCSEGQITCPGRSNRT